MFASDDWHYSIRHGDWAALLGMAAAPELPFHYDWIPALRALTRVVRWLRRQGIDDLSEYLRASQARALLDELSTDLQYAGVPLGLYPRVGPDFWDEFVEIVRLLVRAAGVGVS
jgi:hypothetical protein